MKNKSNYFDYFEEFKYPLMKNLDSFVKAVSRTNYPVLLVGETGTDKLILARHIHASADNQDKPFIVLRCADLSNSSFSSEGTLYLDEIGDLSPRLQDELLGLLKSKAKEKTRLICTTSKNLETLVTSGILHEDLYFAISPLEFTIEPLRKRREDIPILIDQFLSLLAKRHGLALTPEIPDEVKSKLLIHKWFGNEMELRNVIERLIILSQNRAILLNHLPTRFLQSEYSKTNEVTLATLDEIEKQHITNVLRIEPNLDKAAEILGITTVTLWKKRKTYGLP